MLTRITLAAATALALTLPAEAGMIDKVSPHSVPDTIDRLAAAVEGAGATVFARVDHAEGASGVNMELRPTQLLIFGNPELGTPAMINGQTSGLDLPMRVLAYAGGDGVVHVVYHDPADLAIEHGLPEGADYISSMTDALDKLTAKAIAED